MYEPTGKALVIIINFVSIGNRRRTYMGIFKIFLKYIEILGVQWKIRKNVKFLPEIVQFGNHCEIF